MAANLESERLRVVRSDVERACALLASPSAEALDRCLGVLESACSGLTNFRPMTTRGDGHPEVLAEALRLQEAVRRASGSLQIARDYHAKWTQTWGSFNTGYAPQGSAAAPVRRGLLCLTG
jgi:hypothetical protein